MPLLKQAGKFQIVRSTQFVGYYSLQVQLEEKCHVLFLLVVLYHIFLTTEAIYNVVVQILYKFCLSAGVHPCTYIILLGMV